MKHITSGPDSTGPVVLRDDQTGVVHIIGATQTIELPPQIVAQVAELYMGR